MNTLFYAMPKTPFYLLAVASLLAAPLTLAEDELAPEWGEWGEGSSSATTRVDLRESLGGLLVHGIETLGSPDGSPPAQWDTTALADGWYAQTSGTQTVSLAVINSSTVAIEEGRLTANTTWSGSGAPHLLRNHVVVPNGVTLTIDGGSIIKLTENAQIVVEDGGKLIFNDSAGNDVWFAQAEDDSIGGDTDMRDAQANWASLAVHKFPSGTVTEHGYVALNGNAAVTLDTFIPVSLNDAQVMRQSGKAFVPVTFAGTRTLPFSIDWVAEDGSAAFGTDYAQASGTLLWTSSSQGTKYIEIPLLANGMPEEAKTFTVRIAASHGVNVAQSSATVTILDTMVTLTQEELWAGIATSESSRVDTRRGYGGHLVHGIETIGEPDGSAATLWDTTALADGWHTQSRGDLAVSLSVINTPDVSIVEGRLAANTTWTSQSVYVVRNRVVVPSGVTLTIVNGTVVKFTEDTGILVEAGGILNANGATFTHIADDTVGGDTNADGDRSLPLNDQYTIEGAGQLLLTECDFRHRTVVLQQSGPLTASQVWPGNCVYRITGDITIPNGVTLTILEGAVIKFNEGKRITVNSGGNLNVNGTLHNKVIFTSIKDDVHGGDTNGDGKASIPSMGDWKSLLVSGNANFVHCDLLYGGNTNSGAWSGTESGVVTWLGGSSGSMDSCAIMDGKFEGIISYANGLVVRNTIIAYCGRAINSLGGSASLVNCTLYLFTDSLVALAHGGALSLTNCAFANVSGSFFYSNVAVKNCVLWNPPGFGPQTEANVGRNGNIWADPLFRDPDKGDFTLKVGSPCIDAGDGSVAPERDYFGQIRANDPYATKTGTPSANGAHPDIGIHEMTANAVSEVDIAVSRLAMPASASAGDTIQIIYTVTNVGSTLAQGMSRSELAFIGNYGASKVNAGAVSESLSLEPGESVELTASVTVPALPEGDWRMQILLNADRTIFEGRNTANNLYQTPGTIRISMAPLAGTTMAVVKGNGSETFRIDASSSESGTILIYADEGLNIYGGFGYVPGGGRYDMQAVYCGNGVYAISVPQTDGSMYLTIENTTVSDKIVQLEKTDAALSILGVSTNRLPSTGQVTFSIYGTGFTEGATAQLRQGNSILTPISIKHISPTHLIITVSPQYATAGGYDVIVTTEEAVSILSNAIQVTQTVIGSKLEITYAMPNGARAGRTFPIPVTCANIGDADLGTPMVTISDPRTAPANPLEFSLDGKTFRAGTLQFLVADNNGGFDGLNPGQSAITIIYCHVPSDMIGSVSVAVRGYTATDDMAQYSFDVDKYISSSLMLKAEDPSDAESVELLQLYRTALGINNGEFIAKLVRIAKSMFDNGNFFCNDVDSLQEFLITGELSKRAKESKDKDEFVATTEALSPIAMQSPGVLQPRPDNAVGENDVKIYVWKSGWKDVTLEPTGIVDDKNKIAILAHGWRASKDDMSEIASALTLTNDYLVLCIDWRKADTGTPIPVPYLLARDAKKAASYIRDASCKAKKALQSLGINSSMKERLVFIGHSHGAHLVGHVANDIGASLCIGLDTSIERFAGEKIHDVHARDGQDSLFTPTNSIGKTIFFKSSQRNGRINAYADENYIITRDGDFENEWWESDLAFEDSIRNWPLMEARHSWSKTWFFLYVLGRSGWLDKLKLKTLTYWDLVNETQSNFKKGNWEAFRTDRKTFMAVFNDGTRRFEATKQFEHDEVTEGNGNRIKPGYGIQASTWEEVWKKLYKTTDLRVEERQLQPICYANIPFPIHIDVTEQIDNTSLDIFGIDKLGIPMDLNVYVYLYDKNKRNVHELNRVHTEQWRGVLDRTRIASGRAKSYILQDVIITESDVPFAPGETEADMYLSIYVRASSGDGNMNEVFWGDNITQYLPIKVKKGDRPTANIAGETQNGFIIKMKFNYPSIERYNLIKESGKIFPGYYTFDGSNSRALLGRTITRYVWWNPSNPDVTFGNGSTYTQTISETQKRSYPIALTVMDDAGKLGSVHGVLEVDYEIDGETCDCPNHPCMGVCNCGKCTPVPQSGDPNEMAGPHGAGEQRFVVRGEWLDFKVYFENKADAAAAAQEVHVNNALSEYLDLTSFELAEVSFANQIEMGLRGKKSGQIEVAQKGTNTKVRVVVTYDEKTGKVYWYLRSVDPSTTDNWPLDPYAGFLLPNDETGRGEGYVAYRVKVRDDAPHNARIDNSADIIFDYNEVIVTDPAWWNTVYADGSTEPIITTQPSSTTKSAGTSASFTVTATGYAPMTYQWFKDGVALDGKISATLDLPNLTAADAGDYTVAITNIFKTVTSEVATLTVTTPPVIAWMPGSGAQTVQEGTTATFAVNVIEGSTPLTYKWSKNSTLITSATTASYTTPATNYNADNGATFKVEVVNSAGTASLNATLTVTPSAATLAQQVKTQLEAPGEGTVTITGSLDFSLVGGVTIASGKTIVGADANASITGNVTIPAGATNVAIEGVTFANGTLDITGAFDIEVTHCTFIDAPVSITGGADNVTFSWNEFTATGTGSGSAMTIANAGAITGIVLEHNLWGDGLKTNMPLVTHSRVNMFNNYFTVTANTNATIAGAGAQILSVNNIYQNVKNPLSQQNGGLIRACDNFITPSAAMTISGSDTVFVPGKSQVMQSAGIDLPGAAELMELITTFAGNGTARYPQSNATARITATVSGSGAGANTAGAVVPAAGGFTLTASASNFMPAAWQWYRNNFAIAGASASQYEVKNATAVANAGAYSVALTTSATDSDIVTAGAFTVTVGELAAPVITTHPLSQTVTAGANVTFSVVATGDMLLYQWKKGGVDIPGATGPTYTILNTQQSDAASYTVVVSSPAKTVTSNPATLTVNVAPVAPVITAHPVSQTVTAGATVTFTVAVTGSNLTYQWIKNGSNISGATSASYTLTNVQQTNAGSYSVRVSNTAGSVTSGTATLTVNAAGNSGGGAVSLPLLALLILLGAWRTARMREK